MIGIAIFIGAMVPFFGLLGYLGYKIMSSDRDRDRDR